MSTGESGTEFPASDSCLLSNDYDTTTKRAPARGEVEELE
jgi:hypothetical protein